MGCECNKNSKIIFGIAAVMAVAGAIVFISAVVTAGASVSVGFEAENTKSATLTTSQGSGDLGFSLHIKSSDAGRCETIVSETSIKAPSGYSDPWLLGDCDSMPSDWEKEHDPPLRKLGHFFLHEENGVKVYGDYKVTSSAPLWIVDSGEELGEAVGGIFAAIGIIMVAIVLLVIAFILCCVGCCCLGKAPEGSKDQVQTVVVGQSTHLRQ